MRTLEVLLGNDVVGHVRETRKGARFSYSPDAVSRFGGLPLLSLSLPVKERAFGEGKTANWFEGLLPEGVRRDNLCNRFGLDRYDWIGLLAEVGWECAGAVRIYEEGRRGVENGSYERIAPDELARKLSACFFSAPGAFTTSYRVSLGGFQEKICVAAPRTGEVGRGLNLDEVFLPEGGAASTHIIKPEPNEYPGLAQSEAWAMTVAAAAARCSKVSLLALDGAPDALVVERYDRTGSQWPDDATRLHQEDACQALGLAPSQKYASEGGEKGSDPTYRKIADLLTSYADDPMEELAELLRHMTINVALGNWDAHAKNISLLYKRMASPTIAPLYDVVPISEVEPRTDFMSMRIAGMLDPRSVTGETLLNEAVSWGLSPDYAGEIVNACLADLNQGIDAAGERYPQAAERHEEAARFRMGRLLV